MHYDGQFGAYCRKRKEMRNGKVSTICEAVTPLLSVSSKEICSQYTGEDCDCENETTRFDAVRYTVHIRDNFQMYDFSFESWAVCYITDNCTVNTRISENLSMLLTNCTIHLLTLQFDAFVCADAARSEWTSWVHETMNVCRSRLRNSVMLDKIERLFSVTNSGTHCSVKYLMLALFNRIHDELRMVAEKSDFSEAMNLSSAFKSKV